MRTLWISLTVFLAVAMGLQAGPLVVYKGKLNFDYRGRGDQDKFKRDVIIIRDLNGTEGDPDDDSDTTFLINKLDKTYNLDDDFEVDNWIASTNGKKDIEVVELDIQILIRLLEGGQLQLDEDGAAFATGQVKKVKTSKTDSVEVIRVIKKRGNLELEDTSLEGPTPADHDTIVGVGTFKLSARVDNRRTKEFNDPEGPVDGNLEDAEDEIIDELQADGFEDEND